MLPVNPVILSQQKQKRETLPLMPSGIKIVINDTDLGNKKKSVLRCFYIGALICQFFYRIVFSRSLLINVQHLGCFV